MTEIAPDRFERRSPMLLGGLRRRHAYEGSEQTIAQQWREFLSLPELPGQKGSTRFGVMCASDEVGFEYMCAVEVQSLTDLPAKLGRMRVPAQHDAVFTHREQNLTLQTTWLLILDWLSSSAYRSAQTPDFEEYGPTMDPVEPQDGVEIWVGVKPSE